MTAARIRVAITELTHMLTGRFDLPTVLDTVAHGACDGFDASSAAVVILAGRHRTADPGVQVVAEALRGPTDVDLTFLTAGPGLASAREGAVTMITDLTEAGDTRWPEYRRDATQAGMRGVRAFPVTVLGVPLGALVVHTGDPWGARRPNEFGQTLANLTAVAVSLGPQEERGNDTRATVDTLLRDTAAIATATGILAELYRSDAAHARHQLHRLSRAHGSSVTGHAQALIDEYDRNPRYFAQSHLLSSPDPLPPPPSIGG